MRNALQWLRWGQLAGAVGIAIVVAAATTGCSMCCGPYDNHYPTFGGRVQRADPVYGRVGSIFSDPAMAGSGPSADSNLNELLPPPKKSQTVRRDVAPPNDARRLEFPVVDEVEILQEFYESDPQPNSRQRSDAMVPAPNRGAPRNSWR